MQKLYKNVNVHHKMENVNVHYHFLSETYEPVARGTCPLPPFWQNVKKLDF